MTSRQKSIPKRIPRTGLLVWEKDEKKKVFRSPQSPILGIVPLLGYYLQVTDLNFSPIYSPLPSHIYVTCESGFEKWYAYILHSRSNRLETTSRNLHYHSVENLFYLTRIKGQKRIK